MNLAHKLIRCVCLSTVPRRYHQFSTNESVNMKVFTQIKNPITGTTEWDVQNEDYDFHQEIARSAFADMLHDTERNKKYQTALQLAIDKMHAAGKQANVLDIGTGTGLLSIMAAKAGADSIVACEAFKPMAECCLKILQLNGVADKIQVIPKRSTEITVGENGDMKEKANILVTEVFDTELIGEGAVATFSHAHKYLLEKDCIVVPDSAVIYAQVVECPTLWKWNRLNDLADEDLKVIIRTPKKMKQCAGSAAVHDLQLSQLPRSSFKELSEQLPVFYYDWSGRTPIDKNRVVKQQFSSLAGGTAHCVFMWWELNMDTEGKIVLSCAPWWAHPNADLSSERPQDSIPWRDHWMQAVYYLPRDINLQHNTEVTLISCQDEYSLWFYLEDENKFNSYKRPICECGVHMVLSRTHVSYLNDGKRSKKYLAEMREEISTDSVILDLNGSSFLGLAAASMGAKAVYIVETSSINIGIIKDYIEENNLSNVHIIAEPTDEILNNVTNVVADPNFPSAILPWENLKVAYLLYKYSDKLKNLFTILPEACELWGMPVEFKDLHKIRIPLGSCEGIKMDAFDKLVEDSRSISDDDLEAQPLWEYPCFCRGQPRKLLHINLNQLQPTYAADDTPTITNEQTQTESTLQTINGFVVWTSWTVGGKQLTTGPLTAPSVGDIIQWDTHTRQAVKILKENHTLQNIDRWSYQVACDLRKGQFNLQIALANNDVNE